MRSCHGVALPCLSAVSAEVRRCWTVCSSRGSAASQRCSSENICANERGKPSRSRSTQTFWRRGSVNLERYSQEWMGLMVGISNNHLTNYRTTTNFINLQMRSYSAGICVFSAAGWTGFSFIHSGMDLNLIKNTLQIAGRQNVSVLALISRAYSGVGVFLCIWGL